MITHVYTGLPKAEYLSCMCSYMKDNYSLVNLKSNEIFYQSALVWKHYLKGDKKKFLMINGYYLLSQQ